MSEDKKCEQEETAIYPDGRNFFYDSPSTFDSLGEWEATLRRLEAMPPGPVKDRLIEEARHRITRDDEIKALFKRSGSVLGLRLEFALLIALSLLGLALWAFSWL
ncbi:hypothetical protein KYN89_02395 [Alteriqipengyuania sp. NZ-12B]|uniref:Uncharacterized protein n=1 Tax=Alteriqipengyuania abyssalis TaxID=2860200 RepID=A0ABS7PCC6_9SPHN|nr:hypothetical protein [Alteriqipengyuania abyssalis]MBY8335890.1 hypothetical protein [Alteriqipengyuania abyssalis]